MAHAITSSIAVIMHIRCGNQDAFHALDIHIHYVHVIIAWLAQAIEMWEELHTASNTGDALTYIFPKFVIYVLCLA